MISEGKEDTYRVEHVADGQLSVMKDYIVYDAQKRQCVSILQILLKEKDLYLCVADFSLADVKSTKPFIGKIFITSQLLNLSCHLMNALKHCN